jgi:hypothetical protein
LDITQEIEQDFSELKLPEFEFEEMKEDYAPVITIVGEKNSGKTSLCYGFTGEKHFLSFDKKSKRPAETFSQYKNDKSLHFYNASKYYTEIKDISLASLNESIKKEILRQWQLSCVKTFAYTQFLLDNIAKLKPDYIIFDGSEIMHKVCEQVMRYYNKLEPAQGIANRNLWKERNIYWDLLYQKAVSMVKKGLIYTTYFTTVEETVIEGEVINASKQPAWYGSMKLETDVVLYTFSRFDSKTGEKKFFVKTESKIESMPDGVILDVTNKSIVEALNDYLG